MSLLSNRIISGFSRNISNIPGKKINKKIVVIESDDWGSIRMPSLSVYKKLLKLGYRVDSNFFTKYDGLESTEDLDRLFDLLSDFRTISGKNPIFTSLGIMGNPDFEKIKASDFREYFNEPFFVTSQRYDGEDLLGKWKQGISGNVFCVQFHGREHLNVIRWMNGLRNNHLKTTKLCFELGLTGLQASIANENRGDYQAAFDIDRIEDNHYLKSVIDDGIELFKKYLGYNPDYFCPTNGPFNNELESTLRHKGIKYINSAKIQNEPLGDGKFKKNLRFLGMKNKDGLVYLTRNVVFEPAQSTSFNWVDKAIDDIEIAFKWKKPAIISTHRVNYVSRIEEGNRDNGLFQLRELLKKIIMKWPEVEFLSSNELGKLID